MAYSEIHKSVKEVANCQDISKLSGQLQTVKKVADDVRKVSDGVTKVSDGVTKVSDGVRNLSYGVRKVSDGVRNLSDCYTWCKVGVRCYQ